MTLIPVMDVWKGEVVRGVQGKRQTYRPIESALCGSSDPLIVAKRLLAHCASPVLYLADLDALMGGPPQQALLGRLVEAVPELTLWLDAGFADAAAAQSLAAQLAPHSARIVPVFGSESLRSREAWVECLTAFGAQNMLLSLDRRDGQRLDAAGCWEAPSLWPQKVIVMTLERVGAASGPDLETLQALRQRSPQTQFIGAGGLRSPADQAQARAAGAQGWLVASALHDLQLPPVRPDRQPPSPAP